MSKKSFLAVYDVWVFRFTEAEWMEYLGKVAIGDGPEPPGHVIGTRRRLPESQGEAQQMLLDKRWNFE